MVLIGFVVRVTQTTLIMQLHNPNEYLNCADDQTDDSNNITRQVVGRIIWCGCCCCLKRYISSVSAESDGRIMNASLRRLAALLPRLGLVLDRCKGRPLRTVVAYCVWLGAAEYDPMKPSFGRYDAIDGKKGCVQDAMGHDQWAHHAAKALCCQKIPRQMPILDHLLQCQSYSELKLHEIRSK
jgi:hypothetical protein